MGRKRRPGGNPARKSQAPAAPTLPGSLAQHLHEIGAGRKRWPTSDAVRHHYIPQFVLREFLDPSQPRPRLWQLDKQAGEITPQTTEGAASVRRLYRVTGTEGEQNDHLEGFFSMVESHASESLARLRANPLGLTEGDRANISLMLALTDQRTPAGHAHHVAQLSAAARMQTAAMFSDRRRIHRIYRKNNPGATEADAEEFRLKTLRDLQTGELIIEAPKEMAMRGMLASWLGLAGEIHDLSWKVLHADGAAGFVLGDRPVVMHDPTPKYPFSGNGLRSSPNCFTLIPQAPDLCLRLDQRGDRLEERRAERQVADINLRSYGWAERFVYAQTAAVLEELHARAVADPDSVPAPRPDPQVVCEPADPNDPTVGSEHPRGYPRGLWHTAEDGTRTYMAYRLQYMDDERTVAIDDKFFRA